MGTKLGLGTFVLCLAAGAVHAATPGTSTVAAAPTAMTTPSGTCEVVMDCNGATQKTACAEDGSFTFRDVPAGTCTLTASGVTLDPRMAPRDAASGQATGKRQHAPATYTVSLDGTPPASRAAADGTGRSSLSVVFQQRQKELRGHVTLIK